MNDNFQKIQKKNIFFQQMKHYDYNNILPKPKWIKIKLPTFSKKINKLKKILKNYSLNTVCEEALCPNLSECFNNNTATFMILGSTCTRRCPFCAVSKGRPNFVNQEEPQQLSQVVFKMGITYVVITSVNRDDLKDGGAKQFQKCIKLLRVKKNLKIEILVPDFRKSLNYSLDIISKYPPDVLNHNLENVPRLYRIIRPGANYIKSLKLLSLFKIKNPHIPTKSGLMLGLGETNQEIIQVLKDLRDNDVNMLTLGQYLQPSKMHIPVQRYITPIEFKHLQEEALSMGFSSALCGPLIRSSYHAHNQFH